MSSRNWPKLEIMVDHSLPSGVVKFGRTVMVNVGEETPMKKKTAIKLIRKYSEDFERWRGLFESEGWDEEDIQVATSLIERWEQLEPEGSKSKAMRWLGFAQGLAFGIGLYTLEALKQDSIEAIANEEA